MQYFARQLDDVESDTLQLLGEELEAMTKLSSNDPLVVLAVYNTEEERRSIRPRNVRARIRDKLTRGGYGHFREAYLRDRLRSIVNTEEFENLVEQMCIDSIAPLNDNTTDSWETFGVQAWRYDWTPNSGDTDPQLDVDHSELPERIRQTLIDMEAGNYVPMLPSSEIQDAELVGARRGERVTVRKAQSC